MKLGPQDLQLILPLLDQAMDLPVGERQRWLDELPEAVRAHRPMLDRMLAEHARRETNDFLRKLPSVDAGPTAWTPSSVPDIDIVGPYRLLSELGRGGMGSVWLAERVDGLLGRHVALKLPHPGLATRAFAERLVRERDILASLDHPHIARLYDAGVSEAGQPYMALAYVEGRSLIEHCDAGQMGVRQRIALFQQVLEAVQYAHAHLVIHRDIKPSNVLVDGQGQVHLLDFGIAKLIVDGSAEATELTLVGGQALTPDYASPEQIAGETISTVSDVYSLGVLLYELFTGQRPNRLPQTLQAGEPPAASSVVKQPGVAARCGLSAQALAKALRGDLDCIVNKALQKDPARRYASAEALRADLQRHLDGEPVMAQPDSTLYRLGKFVGRHRLPASLALAAVLALSLGAGVSTWQAGVAAQQRDRALNLLARNEAVSEFLDMFITEAAQSPRPMTASELLVSSEALAVGAFRDSPEQQALVLAIVGTHYGVLGEAEKSEALLARALALAGHSGDTSFTSRLSCQHAAALALLGRADEARQRISLALAAGDLDDGTAAQCIANLSDLAAQANDGPAAVAYAQQALARWKTSVRASPAFEASLTGALAAALQISGRNDEAAREYTKALAIYARLGREANGDALTIRANSAIASGDAGDPKAALALIDENLALYARQGVDRAEPAELGNRARMLELMGRFEEATAAYKLALAAAEHGGRAEGVAFGLLGLGQIAVHTDHADEAQALLRRVESLSADARPPGGVLARSERLLRGRLLQQQGQWEPARDEYTAAIGDRRSKVGTVNGLLLRADLGWQEGRLDLALIDAQEALRLAEEAQGGNPYSVRTGMALLIKGRILAQQGQDAPAREAWQAALPQMSNTVDDAHPALRDVRRLLQPGPAPR
ncbi:MAG: protein kinase [Rubrivivax sp.]